MSHFGAHQLDFDAEWWWRRGRAAAALHVPCRQAALQLWRLIGVLGDGDPR